MTTETGFFIDWNGEPRSIMALGEGRNSKIQNGNVIIYKSDGSIDHQTPLFRSLDELQASGFSFRAAEADTIEALHKARLQIQERDAVIRLLTTAWLQKCPHDVFEAKQLLLRIEQIDPMALDHAIAIMSDDLAAKGLIETSANKAQVVNKVLDGSNLPESASLRIRASFEAKAQLTQLHPANMTSAAPPN